MHRARGDCAAGDGAAGGELGGRAGAQRRQSSGAMKGRSR